MSVLDDVKLLIGIDKSDTEQDTLLSLMIDRATTMLESLTTHPKNHEYLIVDAVIYGYNLRGAEGNRSTSSGGFGTSWYYDSMRTYIQSQLPAQFVIK